MDQKVEIRGPPSKPNLQALTTPRDLWCQPTSCYPQVVHNDVVRQWLTQWRTWNPVLLYGSVFWVGGALVVSGLALFAGPHHQAFFILLVLLWAGTLGLVVPAIVRARR
jgi:hypothetical protein